MKKITILLTAILLTSLQFLNASCIDDGKSWSERIFNGYGESYVFICKILEFSDAKAQMTSVGTMGLRAVAQIDKVFFGKIDSDIVHLAPWSHVKVGDTYLIYGGGRRNVFTFGGACDFQSKKIPDNYANMYEVKTLSEISNIINKKLSGHYVIKDDKRVFAEGYYEKGKPVKIWKHYWDNGNIKAVYDFTNNTETQYLENGFKKSLLEKNGNEQTFSLFSMEKNGVLVSKHTIKKTEYGELVTWFEYDDNGKLKKQYTVKNFGHDKRGYAPSGEMFDYQVYYKNGKLKAKGAFFNQDSVGTWYFYSEKGKLKRKKEYKSVDSQLLTTQENNNIEINKYFIPAPTSIFGKVTDKETNKPVEEAYIYLYPKGKDFHTFNDYTTPDGKYEIRNFPAGVYDVKVEVYNQNYKPLIIEVEIGKNEEVELNIQLE